MARITLGNIGQLLRENRGSRGIREVAKEMDVSPATLSRVENGKLPDLKTFGKICIWLKIDASEILGCKVDIEGTAQPADSTVTAHLRADRTLNSEAAQALAEMILSAQQMMARQSNR